MFSYAAVFILCLPVVAEGHGFLKSPRSRNYVAYKSPWWPTDENTPWPESCPQCLNKGGPGARCGKTGDRSYDFPISGVNTPLPNQVQGTYTEGDLIDFDVVISAHHKGHFIYKACPINPGEAATQECFDRHPLTFIRDNLYGAVPDPNYPERAYLPPSTYPGSKTDSSDGISGTKYSHKYRLPEGVHGSNVLIQWHWVTGNSGCSHEGYDKYPWPAGFENQYEKHQCPPLSDNGVGNEQFWNCAEVEIIENPDSSTSSTTSSSNESASTSTTTSTSINTGATITTSSTTIKPTEKKVGDTCEEDAECASGSCFESICECRGDDDCSVGHICNTNGHASDPFPCISGYLKVGEACEYPDQCASRSCFDAVCECRRDSDCPQEEVCDRQEPPFSCVVQEAPSTSPSFSNVPSSWPSSHLSLRPSATPSTSPSLRPSVTSSPSTTNQPSVSLSPSNSPTAHPSLTPSLSPSFSSAPSYEPSSAPSISPSYSPSDQPSSAPSEPSKDKMVNAYYASWQWYDRNKLAAPANIDFTKVDRVNFAFFQTNPEGDLWGTDSWADPQLLFGSYNWNPPPSANKICSWDGPKTKNCNYHNTKEGLIHLAHAAGAEVWPSLGGWSLSDPFSELARSNINRKKFADNCAKLVEEYGFDGIDIDWEYPGFAEHSGNPDDKENFNLLLDDVREALDALEKRTGKRLGLTAALPCGPNHIANIDIPHLNTVLDEFHLMTYDFNGAWSDLSGVHSPLYYQGWGDPKFNVDDCVKIWHESGAPLSKINIGISFYGRTFSGATDLQQEHSGSDMAHWSADEGTPMYYNILKQLPLMTSVRHEPTKTQFAYFSGGGLVTFDDERSICEKTEYVIVNRLNGFLIWELSGDMLDDKSTPLLDSLNKKLNDPLMDCYDGTIETTSSSTARSSTTAATGATTTTTSSTRITTTSTTRSAGTSSPTTLFPTSSPITRPPTGKAAAAVEAILEKNKQGIDDKLLLYQTPSYQWIPSTVYRYNDFLAALRVMYNDGIADKYFFMGDESSDGHKYGLVNIAAFLAQSMKETIQYNVCDENSWDLVKGRYPISNACGQLGQSYQDYKCSAEEAHMECAVNPQMKIKATTNAKWYGAPAPLFCAPKSDYPFTGYWDHSKECNKPWANPPEYCEQYEGQKAGGFDNKAPVPNSSGRTDVEGCCFWGRGVIQTTGVCNFGKLNYYLGARAAEEGRESRYPDINFCERPDAICASEEHKELKWIAGMFYWVESLQSYDVEGWNYIDELKSWVDGGMQGDSFINAVSGIVNRGCHNPPCATGDVDGSYERRQNFKKVLAEFGI